MLYVELLHIFWYQIKSIKVYTRSIYCIYLDHHYYGEHDILNKPVSAKYIQLSDKSSKNLFGPVKIVTGPIKKLPFLKLILQIMYGKDEVQDRKMSSKNFGLFIETDIQVI